MVKNEKTTIDQVRPRGLPESRKPENRQQHQPRVGNAVDGEQRIGPLAMAFEEEAVRDDPRGHHEGKASGIERRDLVPGPGPRPRQKQRCLF
jgi:hypothetical protein